MHHTLAYNIAAATAGASNVDASLVPDPVVTGKNNHAVFTDELYLHSITLVGVSVIRGRIQTPSWNGIAECTIFTANRALTPPTNPQYDLYEKYMPRMPMEEEFAVQISNNLGAATEQENCILQLVPRGWHKNLPRGATPAGMANWPGVFCARASFTLTPTINVWSGGQALTFSQGLRGGLYGVVGCNVQGANAVAWRMIFPRAPAFNGRLMRPGGLAQTAVGDVLSLQIDPWVMGMGTLGFFHTFEPPTIEVLGATAGAITYQVFLWLVYMGENTDPTSNYAQMGA